MGIWAGGNERADGTPFTTRHWQLVDLAVVFEALTGRDQTDDLDGLAGTAQWSIEANTVPALHDLRSAGSDAEHEPTSRQGVQ